MNYFTRFIDSRCIEIRFAEINEDVISEGVQYVLPQESFRGLSFDQLQELGEGMFSAEDFGRPVEEPGKEPPAHLPGQIRYAA